MEPLQNLLNHPYVVSNRLAELLYKEGGAACHVRLRSRAAGKHRFSKEEYKGLVKLFRDMATRLRTKADRLETALQEPRQQKNIQKILEHPTLNLKQILTTVSGDMGKTYYQLYDSLRGRTQLPEDAAKMVVGRFRAFAGEIDAALESAKASAKQYPFSMGRGQLSHLVAG